MEPVFDLALVDTDGAIREAEEGTAGDTRAAFFRKAAIGGGAVLGSSAFLGMLPELAIAKPSKKQDLAILNYALTLEYLEAAFYADAVKGGALHGAAKTFAKTVAGHEATHVVALHKTIKALGGKPVSKPRFDFQGTTRNQGKFLATSFVLENTGVEAYLGQAGRLQSKALLGAAASIVTVEARHASAAAVLNSGASAYGTGAHGITPNGGFDKAASMKAILDAVGKTGFIKG